jgi:hypothetical protein
MLVVDDQWVSIVNEQDDEGEPQPSRFARMVRTQGGMVIGRIIRTAGRFIAERWKYGKFIDIGEYGTIEEAYRALEAYQK